MAYRSEEKKVIADIKKFAKDGNEAQARLLAKQLPAREVGIKKFAKDGNEAQARLLAKQLVRIRAQKDRAMVMKGQVSGIASSMKLMESNVKMMGTAAKVSEVMGQDPAQMRGMMQEYQKQAAQMDMKQALPYTKSPTEMMDDALDNLFDDDEIEEEADGITQQVLDEL
ncbi:hypothetical protein T484DRAFT_1840846, partial [Baffinella frigidus]